MTYVEWLRVRNCLRMLAVILATCLLLALVARIAFARYLNAETWIAQMQTQAGMHVSKTRLVDGTRRTVIDNPAKHVHIVVDDRGWQGMHVVITQPAHDRSEMDHVVGGSIRLRVVNRGREEIISADTDGPAPFSQYAAFLAAVAMIVGTFLGAPFAREREGHLEIALTKPVSRVRYALGAMGVDILGIWAAAALAFVAMVLGQSSCRSRGMQC
jgi:hypothetical protein